ncbi:MAG: OmpA family protein [Oscillatoriaceae cyanobacterium Prado104]|jgi:outer membrane protein OmpA-like peptidoglycan-associated protein|nr:OmpA family protein [Oscillatoriaceae cyanobacterium Prado104]
MAEQEQNLGEVDRSEQSVSEQNTAVPKAGEQLEELLEILTELQLLKKSKKETRETSRIYLPLSEQPIDRIESDRPNRDRLSFTIDVTATHEAGENSEENPNPIQEKDRRYESEIVKPARNYVPSETDFEQAAEKFKRLQQLLFEKNIPELYNSMASVEQRLENFEKRLAEPVELINLLTPLIPQFLNDKIRELKAELRESIAADGTPAIDRGEIEAKVIELQNQVAILSQQHTANPQELIEGLLPAIGELLDRKVAESKVEVVSAISPTVSEVIEHQSGLEEKVATIEDEFALVQQRFQQQPQDLVQQLVPIINESLHRKIEELKSEVVESIAPSAQVRIAWAEVEERVLNIIETRLASEHLQVQQPEDIVSRVMPVVTELLNRKIDESKLQVEAAIAPLMESSIERRETQLKLLNIENQVNNIQRQQKSQPEEILARLMPLMIESLNRKIEETKLEVQEAIPPAVLAALQNSGTADRLSNNENQLVEVQEQLLAQIEGLMARIMPAIKEILNSKISEAKLEIEAAIAPAVDAIIQNRRLEERLARIEQKIVAIEHRIYESTDLFTDLLKPLIDELMVSHHEQLEKSAIASILPLLDEVVNYNYKLNDKVTNLEKKVSDAEWGGDREEIINRIQAAMPEIMLQAIAESKTTFSEIVAPIIDEIIEAKTKQNRQSMGEALAPAIPVAISQRVKESPEEIARAIAPEMAAAIKQQIELEKGAMSDALYPVIGGTILKSIAGTIKSIDEKLERALSFEGINRKLRAKMQGVSEAELLLKESTPLTVKAAFLIHKESGLLIAGVQNAEAEQLESDMVAGMLTAIRSFVNDCIAQSGSIAEVDSIEYGTSKILLEVAGYCYLAVVIQGETRQWFQYKMQAILKQTLQECGSQIQSFNGDPATVPELVNSNLRKLVNADEQEKSSKSSPLLIAGLATLGLIVVPWGIHEYFKGVDRRLAAETNLALQSAPELSVYRLTADVKGNSVEISGRVPNQQLRSKAEQIAKQAVPKLKIDNKIIAVEVPPDPTLVAAEVQRATAILNQAESIDISARYSGGKVAVEGSTTRLEDAQKITQTFEKIPGVKSVTNTLGIGTKLPSKAMSIRLYFSSGSPSLNPKDITDKLNKVKDFLAENRDKNLRIIGYSDFKSSPEENEKLALERARNVKTALVRLGIKGDRMQIAATKNRPAGVGANEPLWLRRAVGFEVIGR